MSNDERDETNFNFFEKTNLPIKIYEYKNFNSIERVSKGHFGEVFRAKYKGSNNYFALKSFFKLNVKFNDDTFKEIVHELKLQHEVDFHENIIRFYGITVNQEKKYLLVLEYADSGTLREYLEKNFDRLTWNDKCDFAYQLASAVLCLHNENILHCDLHSDNILIQKEKTIKLTDFGLSNWVEDATNKKLYGKIAYMDPKLLNNIEYKLNEKSDVYSVGVLLWEISSGKVPFYNNDKKDLLKKILEGAREKSISDSNIPSDYVKLYNVLGCWHEEPDCRPTMEEVILRIGKIKEILNNPTGEKINKNEEKKLIEDNITAEEKINDQNELESIIIKIVGILL